MAGLIVLGSIVRTTGSGLACPDWPLCEGRLIPRFEPHVMIEWGHRLVALLVSVLLLATVAWTLANPPLRRRLGGLVTLAMALLLVQILLGALTVWKLLSPTVVSGHLAVALLLFSTFLITARVASASAGEADATPASRPPGLLPLFGAVTVLAFAQAVLGGVVSTSHAGLACPDWPTCRGEWFPPMQGLVGLHLAHRYGGYGVAVLVGLAWFASRRVADRTVRRAATSALHLVMLQLVIGVGNVLLGTPPAMSALHLGTAAAMLAALIVTDHRLAGLPVAESRLAVAAPATASSRAPEGAGNRGVTA